MQRKPLQYLMELLLVIIVPRQRIGVSVLVFNEHNEVLLLEHVFHPTAPWGPPSGWLRRKESPQGGIIRELREETGLTAHLGPPLLITHNEKTPTVDIIFLAEKKSGDIELSNEIMSYGWFKPEELPVGMMPSVYKAVSKAVLFRNNNMNKIDAEV